MVQAFRFPLFIYGNCILKGVRGSIKIPDKLGTGSLKIGIWLTKLVDKNSETRIDNSGKIVFEGPCIIGRGSKILVSKSGKLSIGNSFNATARLNVICEYQIKINDDCMFSWDVTLIDTDYHPIKGSVNEIINYPKPIEIGNHVWIGFNSQILKGVVISDNSIISSGCTVKRSLDKSNTIYSYPSNLCDVRRSDIEWLKDVF